MNKIKNYYKLCGVKDKDNQPRPFIFQIESKELQKIFTKSQIEDFFADSNIKNTVIGGSNAPVDISGSYAPIGILRNNNGQSQCEFVYWESY